MVRPLFSEVTMPLTNEDLELFAPRTRPHFGLVLQRARRRRAA
jgi:hypothetical protein